jgi:ferredoxin
VTLAWHWPAAYEWALDSRAAHDFEHLSFLAASLLLWYAILEPWPARDRKSFVSRLLLVAAAGLFNTFFSAGFAFSQQPLYAFYAEVPNPWAIPALEDQNAAGAFMWIAGSLSMLVAAVGIALAGLSPRTSRRPTRRARPASGEGGGHAPRAGGRWWERRGTRRALQVALAAAAGLVILDGLFGAQVPSEENLGTVLPWTYWRLLALLSLLVLGNLFCGACPLTLSRGLAARLLGRPFRWPDALRNKWLSLIFFIVYLGSYEVLDLWDRPRATAAWLLGLFLLCFLVEGLFKRGTFCRYVCPVGQFQFVHSGLSPAEVRPISTEVCSRCQTHDCLLGNADGPGCPTGLYLPAKAGNIDCTFCLDCVRACPHDNAGVAFQVPGRGLGRDRVPGRGWGLDLALLASLFAWGGFVNAMLMSSAFSGVSRWLGLGLQAGSSVWSEWLGFLALLILPPLVVLPALAQASGALARTRLSLAESVARFAPGLVPLGFSMWLAHFGFHFVTGFGTVVPAGSRALHAVLPGGFAAVESAAAYTPDWLTDAQLVALGLGLVVSVAIFWRIAREVQPQLGRALAGTLPWFVLGVALWGVGSAIFLSRMEMRGMAM